MNKKVIHLTIGDDYSDYEEVLLPLYTKPKH